MSSLVDAAPLQRDPVELASAKLSGEWSAPQFHSQLTAKVLSGLAPAWSQLDPMVRVRLLLAFMAVKSPTIGVTTSDPHADEHTSAMHRIVALGMEDDDEWVRVTARAVGDLSGQLNARAVLEATPLVSETYQALLQLMESATHLPRDFLPLEDTYMHPDVRAAIPPVRPANHGHFCVRDVGALSARGAVTDFSLTSIAPPVPGAASHLAAHQQLLQHAGPDWSLAGTSLPVGAPSAYARRGTSGTGESVMFRSSKPELLAKPSDKQAGGQGAATPSSSERLATQRSAGAGNQPHKKIKTLELEEQAAIPSLRRRPSAAVAVATEMLPPPTPLSANKAAAADPPTPTLPSQAPALLVTPNMAPLGDRKTAGGTQAAGTGVAVTEGMGQSATFGAGVAGSSGAADALMGNASVVTRLVIGSHAIGVAVEAEKAADAVVQPDDGVMADV